MTAFLLDLLPDEDILIIMRIPRVAYMLSMRATNTIRCHLDAIMIRLSELINKALVCYSVERDKKGIISPRL